MIEVKKLGKIYKGNNNIECKALNKVSFNLPCKGMVFVCGKSGSGKSTLLNLLGGLDYITQGDIVIGGKGFSEFNETDYDNYRNAFVGFIFQDYCLIDNFTVKENIRLALDLQNVSDEDKITEVLKDVDLVGYEDKLVKELSGGQKQRVAIARALIKAPNMILADEPTGNLDSKTSKQILSLLKRLSKKVLVVIVSHNLQDADVYADRIIELSDGQVIKDVERQDGLENCLIKDKTINIPYNRLLTDDELATINEKVVQGGYSVRQEKTDFVDTSQPISDKTLEITPVGKISTKSTHILSNRLFKRNTINSVFTTIMVSLLLIILAVCQLFSGFDGSAMLKDGTDNIAGNFYLYKGYRDDELFKTLHKNKLVEVTEENIQAFYDEGYDGNIYKLYNAIIGLAQNGWESIVVGRQVDFSHIGSLYVDLASGVLECNSDYLTGIYGENGGLRVLAGSLQDTFKPDGVIFTDYLADALMYHNPNRYDSYEDIVNSSVISVNNFLYTVKAVISTNYKERHSKVVSKFDYINGLDNISQRRTALKELREDDAFIKFYNELDSLALSYFFGDYKAAMMNKSYMDMPAFFQNAEFILGGEVLNSGGFWSYYLSNDLKGNEISVHKAFANVLLGEDVSMSTISKYLPVNLTVKEYAYNDSEYTTPLREKTFKVVGVHDIGDAVLVSEEVYEEMCYDILFPYAVCFDNPTSISQIFQVDEETEFFCRNEYFNTIYTVMDIVKVFNELFGFVMLVLSLICVILVISFVRHAIKASLYEIGVFRAIGGTNKDIYKLLLFQLLYLGLAITITSILGTILLDSVANSLILAGLSEFMNMSILSDISIIQFNPIVMIIDVLIVGVIFLISSLELVRVCKRLKPINIIKGKD